MAQTSISMWRNGGIVHRKLALEEEVWCFITAVLERLQEAQNVRRSSDWVELWQMHLDRFSVWNGWLPKTKKWKFATLFLHWYGRNFQFLFMQCITS